MRVIVSLRKMHSILGLMLVIPILGWVMTGMIFIFKPGYDEAYQQLTPKFYAIEQYDFTIPSDKWREVRIVKSVLGQHLLVKTEHQWQHLDWVKFLPMPMPSVEEQIRFLTDAISSNRERYGVIEESKEGGYMTSTGVLLSLNWDTLSIYQSGNDTRFINLFYKIHYLQWLGNKKANIALAVIVLSLLLLLITYGLVLYFRRRIG